MVSGRSQSGDIEPENESLPKALQPDHCGKVRVCLDAFAVFVGPDLRVFAHLFLCGLLTTKTGGGTNVAFRTTKDALSHTIQVWV